MAVQRYRLRFRFWLDVNRPENLEVADQIEQLKNERRFTQTVRDGIRLVCDLRAGRLDVLLEMFPWIKEKIKTEDSAPPDTSGLTQKMDQMMNLILHNTTAPIAGRPAIGQLSGGPRPMAVPQIASPVFEDDDFELTIARDTDTSSAANFLASMNALQGRG